MTMTPQLWSLNALSTETGRDRRTLAKALATVPEDGLLQGHKAWRLTTALAALRAYDGPNRRDPAGPAPPVPPGLEVLERCDNPFDKGALFAATTLAYGVGALAAVMAVHSGAPLKVAFALRDMMTVAFISDVTELFREHSIGPYATERDPNIWRQDHFAEVDWQHMAECAGEPVDLPAWEAWGKSCKAGIERSA